MPQPPFGSQKVNAGPVMVGDGDEWFSWELGELRCMLVSLEEVRVRLALFVNLHFLNELY